MPASVGISFAKYLCAFIGSKGNVESSVPHDLVDDPEVIQHFKAARLKAFALGADEVGLGLIDDAEQHTPPGEITSQGQSRGSGSRDQHLHVNL